MTNYARIDHANKRIVMDRTFAKNAEILGSAEYNMLQHCRQDYPTYTVVRREIKKNANQEHYHGLTYQYMEDYIKGHETPEALVDVLDEFFELRLIAKGHSRGKRYPTIKRWFLDRYPEVALFGMEKAKQPSNVISLSAEKPAESKENAS